MSKMTRQEKRELEEGAVSKNVIEHLNGAIKRIECRNFLGAAERLESSAKLLRKLRLKLALSYAFDENMDVDEVMDYVLDMLDISFELSKSYLCDLLGQLRALEDCSLWRVSDLRKKIKDELIYLESESRG